MRPIAALLFSFCALPAQASFMDGNQLLEWFEGDTSAYKGGALAYVMGVHDGLQGLQDAMNACLVNLPKGVTAKQAADVVRIWLEKHPERRHYRADNLVGQALMEAWPCPK
jgi:hypothetical protein